MSILALAMRVFMRQMRWVQIEAGEEPFRVFYSLFTVILLLYAEECCKITVRPSEGQF